MTPLLFSLMALINAQVYMPVSPYNAPQQQEITDEVDIFLNKLEICESGGRDITILDTNNKYSYAYFQFQENTFNSFGEKYGLPHDDIHSREQQYDIARKMIENGLWTHWYNCSKKIGDIPNSS